ncbi:MAG: amidohydrolase family protein [Burkholderiales bacterium]|nr:amidohydrolase family protein [Burkholderiales bacterium]
MTSDRNQRCLDMHAHHVGQPVVDRINAEGARHGVRVVKADDGATRLEVGGRLTGMPLLPALIDDSARLKWMDEAGIDVQLLSGWMDLAGYHLGAEAGQWLARVQNEALAEIVARRPDRYTAAAMVPLQAPELAAAELHYAVKQLAHRAVQIGARVEEEGLDAPALDPFWKAAEELDVPVIVHPADLAVPPRLRRLFLHILVGNPSETTFAAAALLLGGVFDRFPKLKVLLVHGGGCVPYQFGRIDRGRVAAPPIARGAVKMSLDRYADNLYYDTVLHDDAALRYLVQRAGANHVALGSDYPFPLRDADPVQSVRRIEELTANEERTICWDTGAALLHL